MNHKEFRRALLEDPSSIDNGMREHRDNCEGCRAFGEQVMRFEQNLERALRLTVPIGPTILPFAARSAPPISVRPRRWLAFAASIGIASAMAVSIWLAPRESLAADVVAHTAGEPGAWKASAPLSAQALDRVLERADMTLDPRAPMVTYANSCKFRGNVVPHLVVQSRHGPVTVMVLIHESVSEPRKFAERGYRGTLLPVPHHGSIAVLMNTMNSTDDEVDAVAAQVRNAIVWGSAGR